MNLLILSYLTLSLMATPQPYLTEEERNWYQQKYAGSPLENAPDSISRQKALAQEARRLKLDRDKKTELELNHILSEAFVEMKFKELGWDLSKVPSEGELKAYYQKNPMVKVRHIVVSTPEKAKQVKKSVEESKDFKELVRKFSEEEQTKLLGGLTEDLGKHNFHPGFYRPVVALSKDQVTGPIELEGYFHFFQLVDIAKYDDVRGPYLAVLRQEMQENQKKDWEKKLILELQKRKMSRK